MNSNLTQSNFAIRLQRLATLQRLAISLILAACLLGCSQSDPRFDLKGQITLDGKPLENATLIFTPKRKGQVVAAMVVQGTFTVPQAIGPTLGEYYVRVNPLDGHGEPVSFTPHSKVGKNQQVIPKIYQDDGKLSVSVTGTPGETFLLELFSGATQSHGALRQ